MGETDRGDFLSLDWDEPRVNLHIITHGTISSHIPMRIREGSETINPHGKSRECIGQTGFGSRFSRNKRSNWWANQRIENSGAALPYDA